jgi:dephospho-CoA kinase
MLKVGLTGGIGSGKTTVAKIFSSFGVPVFFADLEARTLMESSEEIIHSIKNYFGEEVYDGSELNRKFLADVVFNDPVKLKKLNQIIHPAVHRRFEAWTSEHTEVNYLIEEAALLCETEAYKYFDFLVLVISHSSKRIERVILRDGVSEEDVRSRMNSQLPDEEKIPLAHFLIFNDEENMLVNQVLAFHEKMISLNKK